jgi:predicted PurR-regulated permease PerM
MEDRNISISITAGTVVKTIVVLAIAWLIYSIRDTVLVVLTAIVLASAIEPGVTGLVQRKIPRILAVILVYLAIFAVAFVIFYFFVPSLLADLATFVTALPSYLDTFTHAGAFDQYAQILGLPLPSAISSTEIVANVRNALDLNVVFGNAFSAATSIFGGVFSFILIVVFSIYFCLLETGVDDFLRIVTPQKHQHYVLNLWRRSQRKIGLWMQGQLLLGFTIGILIYLTLSIFQVPHALVLAVIAGVFEIIPVFGPVLAAIPAIAIAFVAGGSTLGVITIGIYVIIQQIETHLIYPQVVSRVVGVPPLLVIIALIVGGELGGFLGIILSVPMAATLQELARDLESGRLQKHEDGAET